VSFLFKINFGVEMSVRRDGIKNCRFDHGGGCKECSSAIRKGLQIVGN
jgi:hypothetical protein